MKKSEPSCAVGGNADWFSQYGKQYGISSKNLKMELHFNLAILLLVLYPKNPETPIQKSLCTPTFIAALFTIAKCCKQPKYPSVNEWINKLVHLYNGILRSKKEGTPTLHNSMDGTGEHYAK